MASAPEKNPSLSLMIVGAQKAGTTSLLRYLSEHPQLQGHPQKEFSFFYNLQEFEKGYDEALSKYFHPPFGTQQLIAKNAGLYVSESGIMRLRQTNPACKLVLILRNPIDRTYSAYQMERNYGNLTDSFDVIRDIVLSNDFTDWRYEFLVGMSLYHKHIEMLYRHFPKEQLMLVDYDQFSNSPGEICRSLYEWLEIDSSFVPDFTVRYNETRRSRSRRYARFISTLLDNNNPLKKIARAALPGKADHKIGTMLRSVNKSATRPDGMSDEMRSFLLDYYQPYNQKLSQLTGLDLTSWNN